MYVCVYVLYVCVCAVFMCMCVCSHVWLVTVMYEGPEGISAMSIGYIVGANLTYSSGQNTTTVYPGKWGHKHPTNVYRAMMLLCSSHAH